MEQNLGLVYATIKRFGTSGLEQDDLRSEAYVALVRAVEGFNPWLGYRFSTYAWSAISRSLIHVARRTHQHRIRFPVELDETRDEPDRVDDGHELYADRLNLALDENLAELTERESMVLGRRFPTDGGPGLTLVEIGKDIGLSKERVRQIQKSALTKLREVLEADPVLQ